MRLSTVTYFTKVSMKPVEYLILGKAGESSIKRENDNAENKKNFPTCFIIPVSMFFLSPTSVGCAANHNTSAPKAVETIIKPTSVSGKTKELVSDSTSPKTILRTHPSI